MGALVKILNEAHTSTISVLLQQQLVGYDNPDGGFYVFTKRRFRTLDAARRAFEIARAAARQGQAAEIDVIMEADDDPDNQG